VKKLGSVLPHGDPMPCPRYMAAGLYCREESGGLSMESDKEGSAPPIAIKNFEFATCVPNNIPTARVLIHMP